MIPGFGRTTWGCYNLPRWVLPRWGNTHGHNPIESSRSRSLQWLLTKICIWFDIAICQIQLSNPIIFKSNVFDLSILESWFNSKRSLETMNRCQLNDSNYVNIQNLYSIFKSWCQWKSSLFQQQTSWFEIQHRGTSLPNTLSNTLLECTI
jgi:hypothetical protein